MQIRKVEIQKAARIRSFALQLILFKPCTVADKDEATLLLFVLSISKIKTSVMARQDC